MTTIHPARPVRRLTAAFCRHFPIVVELHPQYLTLRLKGQRQGYDLTYERLLWYAYRLAAETRNREVALQRTLKKAC
jgi:hypothetical protein